MQVTYEPIGYARTPFVDKVDAPRQGVVAAGTRAVIELTPKAEFADALRDLDEWERVILLFHFHLALDFRPCVQPPRSDRRRGVLSTRSPHRPNPIGLTVARLVSVEGTNVTVEDVDLLDGTPILDIKPYVPYADAFPEASSGWLDGAPRDPKTPYETVFTPLAEAQLVWLREEGTFLREKIKAALALGPNPHAYRRIRKVDGGLVLSVKQWRAQVRADERLRIMHVDRIFTGFRPSEYHTRPECALHLAFTEAFPA